MNQPNYVCVDELEYVIRNDITFIPDLNKHIYETFKITKNHLKSGSFTYGAYNNWMKMNPGFTMKEYETKIGFFK